LKQAFPQVVNNPKGRQSNEQAWIQMASYGVTLGIAMFSGALCGYLASLFPHVKLVFDDEENFCNV